MKGSGNTRSSQATAPVGYTYDPEQVKFEVVKDSKLDQIDNSKYQFSVSFTTPDENGKFPINDTYWITSKYSSLKTTVNAVVKDFVKTMYRNNEQLVDRFFRIGSDNDNAPSAWVFVNLVGNNKIKVTITAFPAELTEKPETRVKIKL